MDSGVEVKHASSVFRHCVCDIVYCTLSRTCITLLQHVWVTKIVWWPFSGTMQTVKMTRKFWTSILHCWSDSSTNRTLVMCLVRKWLVLMNWMPIIGNYFKVTLHLLFFTSTLLQCLSLPISWGSCIELKSGWNNPPSRLF